MAFSFLVRIGTALSLFAGSAGAAPAAPSAAVLPTPVKGKAGSISDIATPSTTAVKADFPGAAPSPQQQKEDEMVLQAAEGGPAVKPALDDVKRAWEFRLEDMVGKAQAASQDALLPTPPSTQKPVSAHRAVAKTKVGKTTQSKTVSTRRTQKLRTIQDVLSAIYLHSQELEKARTGLHQAAEECSQQNGLIRPQLSASFSQRLAMDRKRSSTTDLSNQNTTFSGNRSWSRDLSASLNAQQRIYEGGSLQAGRAQARYKFRSAVYALVQKEQEAFLKATQRFLDIVILQEALALARQRQELLGVVFRHARALSIAGQQKITDLKAARARLAEATASTKSLELDYLRARADLANMVQTSLDDVLELPDFLNIGFSSEKSLIETALKTNPALVSAQYELKASKEFARAQLGKMLPSVSLQGRLSRGTTWSEQESLLPGLKQPSLFQREHPYAASIALDVSIPLSTGGQLQSQYRQAELRRAETTLDFQIKSDDIETQCQTLFASFVIHQQNLVSAMISAEAATEALNAGFTEYAAGIISLLDALYHQDLWQNASERYLTAKKNVVLTSYELLSLTGQLTAAQLGLDVDLFDPMAYYREYVGALFSLGEQDEMKRFFQKSPRR